VKARADRSLHRPARNEAPPATVWLKSFDAAPTA